MSSSKSIEASPLRREAAGVTMLALGIFLGVALLLHLLAALHLTTDARASVGWVGAYLARPIVWLFGWPAALLLPVAIQRLAGGDAAAASATFRQASEIGDRFGDPDLAALGRLGRGPVGYAVSEAAAAVP